jgi:hypothetical protein
MEGRRLLGVIVLMHPYPHLFSAHAPSTNNQRSGRAREQREAAEPLEDAAMFCVEEVRRGCLDANPSSSQSPFIWHLGRCSGEEAIAAAMVDGSCV